MTMLPTQDRLARWALYAFAIAAVLSLLVLVASLILIYWADEFASPSWNEQSFPPPRTVMNRPAPPEMGVAFCASDD